MDIIIIGLGAVGTALTESLAEIGHNVVVVDNNKEKVENAVNEFDVKGVVGNGASYEVLKEAGIGGAELLIAATSLDEVNILCCVIAKKLGADRTIARVAKAEYIKLLTDDEDLGVSLMVNPQHEAALEISRILRFPSSIKVDQFAEGRVELVEYKVPEGSPLSGVALKNLSDKLKCKVLICAVNRDGQAIIPTGDFVIAADDHLFLTATTRHISDFFKRLGLKKQSKNVIIVGGSRTAMYLCEALKKSNIRTLVIEKDAAKCRLLSEVLPKTDVICGDGTDQKLLHEEGLDSADAFVALGDSDEQNIIMSMFAKSENVPKIVTKIDQSSYYKMLQNSGIDSIVSTKTSTADQIIRFVRSMGKDGNTVKKLFRIIDEQAEALEFSATPRFKKLGVPIMDLHLKKDLLLAGIIRDDELITPSGKDCIMEKDSVIVFTLNEGLDDLNDVLDAF